MAESRFDTNVDSLHGKIDRAFYMREDIRIREAELKESKRMLREIEADIMDLLEDQELSKVGTDTATVSMSYSEVPTVDSEHWEDVWAFLMDNGYTECLRKQLNSTPWAELRKIGVEVPYVSATTQRKLNLRKA
jgi:hypothetical protein